MDNSVDNSVGNSRVATSRTKILLSGLLIVVGSLGAISTPATYANEFPGEGEYKHWQKASELYDQGVVLNKAGKYDQAIQLFNKALKSYRQDPWFYIGLGSSYRGKKNLKMAENYYRKAAKVDPDLPNAWFYLALLLEDKKEVKEAEELYHKAAYMNPEYGDAWHRLGMLLWEERRYKEAKEAFAMEHGCPLNAEQRKELQATMKSLDLLISESELQNRQH